MTAKWLQRLALSTLEQGKVPKHVLFFPDGARRFRKKSGLELSHIYELALDHLEEYTEALINIGVPVITIYLSSIMNLRRDSSEVAAFMTPIQKYLEKWSEPRGLAHKLEFSVKHYGERSVLSPQFLEVLDRAVVSTQGHDRASINIVLGYSGRWEILQALTSVAGPPQTPDSQPAELPFDKLTKVIDCTFDTPQYGCHGVECLLELNHPPVDIFIRTGEVRLSDTFMWGVNENTEIFFSRKLWPEFGFWDLIYAIFVWQTRVSFSSE